MRVRGREPLLGNLVRRLRQRHTDRRFVRLDPVRALCP
jgi:hypothetical protein